MTECAHTEKDEETKAEQRRMWCLVRAMELSMQCFNLNPELPLIPVTQTAEEMLEFVETGVARTPRVKTSRRKQ